MIGSQSYLKKVTIFFSDYVTVNPVAVNTLGNLTPIAIQEAARLLINEKVFESIEEMKKVALQEQSIILADWIFEGVAE